MGQTIVEKIISHHCGRSVYQNDLVVAEVDAAMASDTTAPLTIQAFQSMGGKAVWDPKRCFLIIDHAAPAPNERIANLHLMMREFARDHKDRDTRTPLWRHSEQRPDAQCTTQNRHRWCYLPVHGV